MSIEQPLYAAGEAQTVEAMRNRPCSLHPTNPAYIKPTPDDVRTVRRLARLSQRQAAMLVGVQFNHKGSNTVRKWETAEDSAEHREISSTAWRQLLYAAGVVSFEEDLAAARSL